MQPSTEERAFTGTRSRILFLSHDMLWPTVGGGRLRCWKLLKSALLEARVDLVVVAPQPDVARDTAAVPQYSGLTTHIFVDESPSGPAPARFSQAATDTIRAMAEDGGYDAVHVEASYLLPVVPLELRPRAVVVEHNIESQLLGQRAAIGEAMPPQAITGLREREELAWRQAGAVIALSPEDAAEICSRAPGIHPALIQCGWDHLPARTKPRPGDDSLLSAPRLLFIADYDNPPNRDAFAWLVSEIFPLIRLGIPGARLVLAGINLSPDLAALAHDCAGTQTIGYVDDLIAELDRADIVFCPLRVGGGVKVKVIEAIRRACLLVSTTAGGTGGIPEPLRSAICFADDSAGLAEHVIRLCADPEERCRRRAQLIANQAVIPTWDDSSVRTLRLWSKVAARVDAQAPDTAPGGLAG